MQVYRLLNDINHFHEAFLDFKNFRKQFNDIKVWFSQENTSLLDKLKTDWTPLEVTFSSESKTNKIPDISIWNLSCLILSHKAETLLRPFLSDQGELLPLEQGYYLFNCLQSIQTKTLETIQLSNKTNNIKIFKPKDLHNGFLICQEDFKAAVTDNHLSGILFEENLSQIFSK